MTTKEENFIRVPKDFATKYLGLFVNEAQRNGVMELIDTSYKLGYEKGQEDAFYEVYEVYGE